MSRIISFVFLMLIADSTLGQVNIAVFGGLNNSRSSLKDFSLTIIDPVQDPSLTTTRDIRFYYRNSFYGGLKLDIQVANSLLFSPKLLIESSGYQENFEQHFFNGYGRHISDSIGGKDIVRLTYLTLPLHLVFLAPLGKAQVFIGAGGFMSLGLTGTSDFQMDYTTFPTIRDSVHPVTFSKAAKYQSEYFHANRFDYGLSVTGGIQFRNGIFLEAMMDYGFQTVFTDKYTIYDSDLKEIYVTPNRRRNFMIGIGYRFKRNL